jgi:hypothetical protein
MHLTSLPPLLDYKIRQSWLPPLACQSMWATIFSALPLSTAPCSPEETKMSVAKRFVANDVRVMHQRCCFVFPHKPEKFLALRIVSSDLYRSPSMALHNPQAPSSASIRGERTWPFLTNYISPSPPLFSNSRCTISLTLRLSDRRRVPCAKTSLEKRVVCTI